MFFMKTYEAHLNNLWKGGGDDDGFHTKCKAINPLKIQG
jgi:hypothetical protein